MYVRVDTRQRGAAQRLTEAIGLGLRHHALTREIDGSVYLGVGAADLIHQDDPRPHVVVPLTQRALYDPVGRAQIAAADAVVFTDRAELTRLADDVTQAAAVVVIGDATSRERHVIHADNPFDAVEVDRFRGLCGAVALALEEHGAMPPPFSPSAAVEAILEALTLNLEPSDSGPIDA
jgi:hypothetical protein